MISKLRIIWLFAALLCSVTLAYFAFNKPLNFVGLIDLTATILSILIGVSLALTAVLGTKLSINSSKVSSDSLRERMEEVIADDDSAIIDGQFYIFWLYYVALLLALSSKWLAQGVTEATITELIRIVIAVFVFFSTFALLMSANLPFLLRQVSTQRKELE